MDTARVTPIFKEGDKSERSNDRPISVLPVLTRLFETLIFNQLYKYLNDNNLLSQEQSGFRALHSTVSCLLKSSDDWYSALDNSEMVGAASIDLRKAFDTVDHSLLSGKLEWYGVRNDELRWSVSLILQVQSNFEETPGLMQLTFGCLKARVLVLSYSLSISMTFLKS